MLSIFTEFTINQLPLWAVLLVCAGVFLASLMDAIAGGGGIISVPTYLIAFSGLPTYYALGTNKLSAGIGTIFSTARFIKNGLVDWRLAGPGVAAALVGSMGGTWLQLRTPDIVLRYLLLAVLPVVAFVVLRGQEWPDTPGSIQPWRQAFLVWGASLIVGAYDGYYGPGTGTFLMIAFIRLAKLDTLHAAGAAKAINLASNLGSLVTALLAGYVSIGIGLIASAAAILGHYLGAGLAIKNGGICTPSSSRFLRSSLLFLPPRAYCTIKRLSLGFPADALRIPLIICSTPLLKYSSSRNVSICFPAPIIRSFAQASIY